MKKIIDSARESALQKGKPPTPKELEKQAVLEEAFSFIEKKRGRRQVNKLFGHPSPSLWRETDIPLRDIMERRKRDLSVIPKKLNLYLATPYCLKTDPPACGYCLFPHEVYQGLKPIERYFDHVRKEGAMYREFFSEDQLAGIYFGGGTPNILKADVYPRLIEIVQELFPHFPENIEITLEGVPQLFTWEKLVTMKKVGINRISMGVQQLNDDLIKYSGRRQNSKQVFQVLEWCDKLGLKTNIDLIYGWPKQSVDLMIKDLEAVVCTGINHLTHYELNLGGRSYFHRYYKNELPSIEENRAMFHASKAFLEGKGFRQMTTYDWERDDGDQTGEFAFEKNMRQFLTYSEEEGITGTDIWGWGFGGVSHFIGTPENPGISYINTISVDEYVESVAAGKFPILRSYRHDKKNLRISWLFQSLQSIHVNCANYRKIFGDDLLHTQEVVWHALKELEWVEIKPNEISLIGDGIYYTPLIQNLFSKMWNRSN